MTTKEKMVANGKRWQKNGMDRYYINFYDIADIEVDEIRLENYFNRFQKGNIKIFWDMVKDELVVTVGNDGQKAAVEKAIMAW